MNKNVCSLSVIVPIYNAETTIQLCLDSILNQSYRDFELILIDDGSTDNSGKIMDQYMIRDSRIRVIHKENEGLVAARKTGVQVAKGKYVAYVDSDDWIEPQMYEVLCGIAEQYQVDLVSSGIIWERKMPVEFYDGFKEGLYVGEKLDFIRDQIFFYENDKNVGIGSSLCTKLFRTSILKKVQLNVPDEVSNCEDRLCTVAYMLEVKSAYILKRAFYHYIFRDDSMFHREDIYYLDKLGPVHRTFQSMYQHPNFSEKLRIQCQLYMMKMVLDGLNEHMGFPISDLMWISPNWMEQFPSGARILLYGAGRLGRVYYRHMASDRKNRLHLSGWVDRNYQDLAGYPKQIESPDYIKMADYDYILLALKDRQPAEKLREQLIEGYGIAAEKIVWMEQHEIFWDYAEAMGVFGEDAKHGIAEANEGKC